MDILTNTDDVDENRKKRSTVNCFDLIASINKLVNVLNGTEIAEYDVEVVVELLTNIALIVDMIGCGCDYREKNFVSHQLDLLDLTEPRTCIH